MKAVTVTFNPSFDTTLMCDALHKDKANRVISETTQAGGKGINVSRVLNSLGVKTIGFCLVGEEDGNKFMSLLNGDCFCVVQRAGKTRENLTLRADDGCMKINRKGEKVSAESIRFFEDRIISAVDTDDIVIISGSLAVGYTKQNLLDFCERLNEKKVKIILDTDIDLEFIKRVRPFMIKPNEYEITDITGDTDSLNLAAALCFEAGAQNVLITLGEKGLLAKTQTGEYYVMPPKIDVKSTVGAGDSAVAGFTAGVMMGLNTEDVLALSVASGTATAAKEGTHLADMSEINLVKSNVRVIRNV